jgi:hypothetical protein
MPARRNRWSHSAILDATNNRDVGKHGKSPTRRSQKEHAGASITRRGLVKRRVSSLLNRFGTASAALGIPRTHAIRPLPRLRDPEYEIMDL